MKIFLISNMYPSKKDSLYGVFVKNSKTLLEQNGVQFSAISVIKGKKRKFIKKIPAYFIYYGSILFNYIFKKFDLIYVHYLTLNSFILTFLPIKNKPLVINVHGSDVINAKGRKIDKFNRYVLKRVDLIVVPSPYFKKVVLQQYPFLTEDRIFISPSSGVDGKKFFPKKRPQNDLPVLGMVSRLEPGKGWEDFLTSLSTLKQKGLKFKVIIAGRGSQKKEFLKMIADLNLKEEINFLGIVKQENLVDLYTKIDVLIFPTKREAESLGLVGLEAMSCMTPVIAGNIGGPKTYIKNGENGFLFEPGNSEELSKKILYFLNLSSEEKRSLRENAFQTAQDYESKNVTKKLHQRLIILYSEK